MDDNPCESQLWGFEGTWRSRKPHPGSCPRLLSSLSQIAFVSSTFPPHFLHILFYFLTAINQIAGLLSSACARSLRPHFDLRSRMSAPLSARRHATEDAELAEVAQPQTRHDSAAASEQDPVSCNICNQSYARLDHLTRHLRTREF